MTHQVLYEFVRRNVQDTAFAALFLFLLATSVQIALWEYSWALASIEQYNNILVSYSVWPKIYTLYYKAIIHP